jgi:hypothetical protein
VRRLLVVGSLVALIAAACGDDSSVTTSTTSATTTTAATTTTTTEPPATTTTEPPATTTTEPPATTTTEPPIVFGFFMDGLGVAEFGDSPANVISALTVLFGDPSRDTGWVDEPICPGPMTRVVGFGVELFDFDVYFTTGGLFAPAGTEHFHGYNYNGATAVPVSPPDLTVGTKISELEALYPSVEFLPSPFFAGEFEFHVDGPGNEGLNGQVSGTNPGDVVLTVKGGVGCGE